MTVLLFFLGLLECAALYFIAQRGKELEQTAVLEERIVEEQPPAAWPKAALIIPVAGERPDTFAALQSLLDQDYPNYVPFIVTATRDEPASGLIEKLRITHPALRHVVAGSTEKRGQKNHNLLAAVEACGTGSDGPEVYVFCDSTHIAQKNFLRCLLYPIARNEAAVCTGYHQVLPRDNSTITLAYAQSVLLMRFLQSITSFTQPWGGALAITRQAFDQYNVANVWASNVVDDCSLAALLMESGVKIRLCPAALLRTYAENHVLAVWRAWLARQVLFLKFCMPNQWLMLGCFAALVAIPPIWCAWGCTLGILGDGTGTAPFLALCWLCLICWIINDWRNFLPETPYAANWIWAFFCASVMFAVVWLGTLWRQSILWQNRLYRVGPGGRVREIHKL